MASMTSARSVTLPGEKRERPKITDVSRRFKQNCDVNSLASFRFVGQTATRKEKMLKTRAQLLANE